MSKPLKPLSPLARAILKAMREMPEHDPLTIEFEDGSKAIIGGGTLQMVKNDA